MSQLPDSSKTFVPFQFKAIVEMVNDKPNDMDLGKAVRKLINEYNNEINKPPFTEDYIQ